MKDIYPFLRKYIGPVEMIVIILLLFGVCVFLEHRESKQKQEQLMAELKAYTEENIRINEELRKKKEYKEPIVMDSIYAPFIVDSLCRYKDSTYTTGYITLTKYAPYQKLCSTEDNYYMWVGVKEIFPMGQLVQVNGIAENEELIQFHFRIVTEESLDDMLSKLDSTLQSIKGVSLK